MSEVSPHHQKLFEELKETFNGVECWDARLLWPHVGYSNWRDFDYAIQKAMQACRTNGEPVENQFLRMSAKTSPKGGRPGVNYKLTRRACYYVFQNGDPKVPGIAAAQAYFVEQAILQEQEKRRAHDWKRIAGRDKLTAAESAMNKVLLRHSVTPRQVAAIRSNGDSVFFGGHKTADMKKKLGVPDKRPLADFLALVLVSAKATTSGLTALNTENKGLQGFHPINGEHVKNNQDMRDLLGKSGVIPEAQPAATDIQQVYVRLGLSKGPAKPVIDGQQSLFDGAK